MVYCIIVILLSVTLGLITLKLTDDEETACNIGTIVTIAGIFMACMNNLTGIEERVYTRTVYEIASLEIVNSENYEGMFILGTGYINSSNNLNYIYFANTQYGKQLKTVNAESVYLSETNAESPKLIEEVQQSVRKMTWIDKLWGTDEEEQVVLERVQKQILIVPENTIKLTYNVEI